MLFTSCNITEMVGTTGIIGMFIIMILIFAGMFTLIIRSRRKKDLSLTSFSHEVKNMLDRIASQKDKVRALQQLIERIEGDEKYKKTPDWKNSVLAKVYEHLAAVYFNAGDEAGVIDACTHIIALNPSHGMSYYNRGSIYNNQEQFEKAIHDFNDAITLMPDYSNAYNNRGLAYDRLGRYEEALSDFNYAIELEPSAIIYYNRASLQYEKQNYTEAKNDYSKYLELDPDNKDGLKVYAEAAIDLIEKKLSEEK